MEFYTNKRKALKRIEKLALAGISYQNIRMDINWNFGMGERIVKQALNDLMERDYITFDEDKQEIKVLAKAVLSPTEKLLIEKDIESEQPIETEEEFEERFKRITAQVRQKEKSEDDKKEE